MTGQNLGSVPPSSSHAAARVRKPVLVTQSWVVTSEAGHSVVESVSFQCSTASGGMADPALGGTGRPSASTRTDPEATDPRVRIRGVDEGVQPPRFRDHVVLDPDEELGVGERAGTVQAPGPAQVHPDRLHEDARGCVHVRRRAVRIV